MVIEHLFNFIGFYLLGIYGLLGEGKINIILGVILISFGTYELTEINK